MTTKTCSIIMSGLICMLCVMGTFVWTGCDTASATEDLVVSPSSATLSSGQSQTFTVSGGYHYTWSIGGASSISSSSTTSSAQGSLSSLTGSQVLYTAPSSDTLSGSVTLTVNSTIEGSGEGISNSPAYSVTGNAIVTFK